MTVFFAKAKRTLNQWDALATDQSQLHKKALALRDSIRVVLRKHRGTLPPAVKQAAEQLANELSSALRLDGKSRTKDPLSQRDLAEACSIALYKYRPTLESAPGFWNQLKANMNALIEALTGYELFVTTKTVFGLDERYREELDELNTEKARHYP